jgi:hypothetical protein
MKSFPCWSKRRSWFIIDDPSPLDNKTLSSYIVSAGPKPFRVRYLDSGGGGELILGKYSLLLGVAVCGVWLIPLMED